MMGSLHKLHLPGPLLARGFWLYVWEVTCADGGTWLYIGRTGDSSSNHAQSPFARLSQHLGNKPKSNALRRHLTAKGIDADTCSDFRLAAYGPIFPEEQTVTAHRASRDVVAALEKALCEALRAAGYRVLNTVHCRHKPDETLLSHVLFTFAEVFPKLQRSLTPASGYGLL